ncbi:MAG TPA: ATP-binding protein [Cyclobacteriaceae bacterium]|nr:ATP-binding protein [Cyclobacteriaceae bacterium]
MIKVCFYGAESTGKSTMARQMAEYFNTNFVPEVARELVSSNDFSVEDIIKIGNAQTARIASLEKLANSVLICDTDLITTQIYSKHYLGIVPEVLYELESQVHYDRYFLFDIDVPWVADGLRDLQNQREQMHSIFKNELEIRKIDYVLVRGNWDARYQIVVSEINRLLRESKEF